MLYLDKPTLTSLYILNVCSTVASAVMNTNRTYSVVVHQFACSRIHGSGREAKNDKGLSRDVDTSGHEEDVGEAVPNCKFVHNKSESKFLTV